MATNVAKITFPRTLRDILSPQAALTTLSDVAFTIGAARCERMPCVGCNIQSLFPSFWCESNRVPCGVLLIENHDYFLHPEHKHRYRWCFCHISLRSFANSFFLHPSCWSPEKNQPGFGKFDLLGPLDFFLLGICSDGHNVDTAPALRYSVPQGSHFLFE